MNEIHLLPKSSIIHDTRESEVDREPDTRPNRTGNPVLVF